MSLRIGTIIIGCTLLGAAVEASAQEPRQRRTTRRSEPADIDQESSDEFTEERRTRRRTAPSNLYIDPASFFRLHGYATLSYSLVGEDLGREPLRAPDILVGGLSPRTGDNEGGFRHDAAVFVGAEPFDGVSATVELHFVGNGFDPVLTEAKATWEFLSLEETGVIAARFVGGRYWWPFGNHNGEWFSAVNRFALISVAAAEVVPAHYNEVGVMLEGEISLTPSVGFNAAFSVGNGVPSFELSDVIGQTAFDFDGDLAPTARVALYVVTDVVQFEAGFSIAGASLRDGPDTAGRFDEGDPRNFAADYLALGGDVSLQAGGFDLTAYYYASTENLTDAPVDKLDRSGFTTELGYRFDFGYRFLKALGVAARVSYASEESLGNGTQVWLQYGGALYLNVTRSLTMRASYLVQDENDDATDLDNNVLSIGMTAEF